MYPPLKNLIIVIKLPISKLETKIKEELKALEADDLRRDRKGPLGVDGCTRLNKPNRTLENRKESLAAEGYTKCKGVYFIENFSLVTMSITIRSLITIETMQGSHQV